LIDSSVFYQRGGWGSTGGRIGGGAGDLGLSGQASLSDPIHQIDGGQGGDGCQAGEEGGDDENVEAQRRLVGSGVMDFEREMVIGVGVG
jgi:hypothetical protein